MEFMPQETPPSAQQQLTELAEAALARPEAIRRTNGFVGMACSFEASSRTIDLSLYGQQVMVTRLTGPFTATNGVVTYIKVPCAQVKNGIPGALKSFQVILDPSSPCRVQCDVLAPRLRKQFEIKDPDEQEPYLLAASSVLHYAMNTEQPKRRSRTGTLLSKLFGRNRS